MSKIAISYNSLENAASEARGVATKLNGYANALEWSVQRKFGNYDGEWTDNVSTAYTSISNKMNNLRDLSSDYTIYAEGLTALKAECKRTDTAVRTKVQELVGDFKELHGIRDSVIENAISYYITKADNSAGWLRQGSDFINDVAAKTDGLFDSIEEWYDYEGGKELLVNGLVAVLEIVGGVLAVLGAIASGAGLVVLVAGIIGGVIAVMNGVMNLAYEMEAYRCTNQNNDPVMGARRSDINSMQDALRSTDDKFAHNVASGIDAVVFVCTAIDLFDSIPKLAKNGYKWLTGDARSLKEIGIKDLLSSGTKDAVKNKADDFVNGFRDLKTAVKDRNYMELGHNLEIFASDFSYSLKNYYADFSSEKGALKSTSNIVSASKKTLTDGWNGFAESIIIPGLSDELLSTEVDGDGKVIKYTASDFGVKDIKSAYGKTTKIIGEKGLMGIYDKLQTPSEIKISVPTIDISIDPKQFENITNGIDYQKIQNMSMPKITYVPMAG